MFLLVSLSHLHLLIYVYIKLSSNFRTHLCESPRKGLAISMVSSDLDNVSFLLSGARDAKFAQRPIPKCKYNRIAGSCVHEGGDRSHRHHNLIIFID